MAWLGMGALFGRKGERHRRSTHQRVGLRVRASVVVPRGDEILLIRHRRDARFYWVLPGGAVEAGEELMVAAAREVREGSGLEVRILRLIYVGEVCAPAGGVGRATAVLGQRVDGPGPGSQLPAGRGTRFSPHPQEGFGGGTGTDLRDAMKPCVVVSRQMGSDGGAVAITTSELTGYRLVLVHTIGKLARRYGSPGSEWRWLDQDWHRLFARLEDQPHVKLASLRRPLLEAATDRRGTLFLGRGIAELLQGHVPLLRVHVVAPFERRVERIMQQVNLMHSSAEGRVRRSDEENTWFYRHFFQGDWADPGRYDLVLDTSLMPLQECAQRIADTLTRRVELVPADPGG